MFVPNKLVKLLIQIKWHTHTYTFTSFTYSTRQINYYNYIKLCFFHLSTVCHIRAVLSNDVDAKNVVMCRGNLTHVMSLPWPTNFILKSIRSFISLHIFTTASLPPVNINIECDFLDGSAISTQLINNNIYYYIV